jgi:VCBS repeat-containing protein
MTPRTFAKWLILLIILLISVPAGAGQLVSASLKDGSYGAGTAVPPTTGIVNTADGVLFFSTEAGGRSNALVNWQIGNNSQWRRSGTIAFLFKATRGQFVSGQLVNDNYGFGKFNNGQSTFSISAGPAANGPGPEDDRVAITWATWHNNVWYSHATTQLEYDRWYSLGFAWGGPSEFEIWVDQELRSAVNLAAAAFPWGSDFLQSGFNMGIGDNHERGVDGYNSAAGVIFADLRMWDEYRAFADTVPGNHPPSAADDAHNVDEDGILTVAAPGVIVNDLDEDADTLLVSLLTDVAHGTLMLAADGGFVYEPQPGYHGPDSFTYEVSDGEAAAEATVTITVVPVNDAPAAGDDAAETPEDTTVIVDVLANDADADGDALLITQAGVAVGVIAIAGDTLVFTPPQDFSGTVAVSYTVSDGRGGSAQGTLSISVTPINDSPTTSDVTVTTQEGVGVTVTLTGSDIDSQTLTFTAGATTGGTVSGTSPTFTFVPAAGFTGQGGFAFVVSDGDGGTATGAVEVIVTAAPPPPPADFDSVAGAIAGLPGLNHGQRTSLLARLRNAQRALAHHHVEVAVRDLQQIAESLARFSQTEAAADIVTRIETLAASLTAK